MTPEIIETLFVKYWQRERSHDIRLSGDKEIWKAAWLETTRQAYEDCARICERYVLTDEELKEHINWQHDIGEVIARDIRQKIK